MTNMRKEFLYIGMVISVLLLGIGATAQSIPAGISADITADKQAILIGEPIRLTLTVRSDKNQLVFADVPDSFPHFEVLSKGKIDTVAARDQFQLQQVITVTSFDSGRWVIPSFELPGTNIVTDSITVDVGYMPMKSGSPLRDIKDIIPVHVNIPWLLLIGSALLLIVLVILFVRAIRSRKKAPGKGAESGSSLTPYEEAVKALEALNIPAASADIKPFYTSLDDILRRYFSRAYNWKASQYTTTDILMKLPDIMTGPDDRSELAEALRLGDAVKFARFFPESAWQTKSLGQVRKAIDTLHKT
jgi:hypothetical protein